MVEVRPTREAHPCQSRTETNKKKREEGKLKKKDDAFGAYDGWNGGIMKKYMSFHYKPQATQMGILAM